jgi:hypothetical protein
MRLGAQDPDCCKDPDCCNWGFEGEESSHGSELIGAMKMKFFPQLKDEGEVVAAWGQVQLLKYLDGKVELNGGSKEDRLAAKEWMSLFWHKALVGKA